MSHPQESIARVLFSSLRSGGIFAFFYFLLIFGSMALVTGEGRAPRLTHFAVWTMEFAWSSLGIKNTSGSLFSAIGFWSAGFAVLVFAYKCIVMLVRETDTRH
jgi:hypothetical protein